MRDQRRALAERLRENSAELEETIFDRICALASSRSQNGHHPMRGVRNVVQSALMHGIDAVELGEQDSPPPPSLIDHARKAAWGSVPFQTINEHYLAGYSIFKDFLLRESPSIEIARQVQGTLDVIYRRLIRVLGEEHQRELQKRSRSSDLRRLERVEELLSGDLQEAPDLQYHFGETHLGLVASGREVESAIRQVANSTGSLLLVNPTPCQVWAWIGTHREISSSEISRLLEAELPSSACISIGEPAQGLSGWRRTHRQANTSFAFAIRNLCTVVHYREVAVLACFAGDTLLTTYLRDVFLAPLEKGQSGDTLRRTLDTYFSKERSISSTAAALGVHRRTVRNRLNTVEGILGQPLPSITFELEAALRLSRYQLY